MNYEDIQDIILEQGQEAKSRQDQIKRLIFVTWVYILIATAVMTMSFKDVTDSNRAVTETNSELISIIDRRSPILEYISCTDELERKRDAKQTEYVFTYIDLGSDPTESEIRIINEARNEYVVAESNLGKLEGCPKDLPGIVQDRD